MDTSREGWTRLAVEECAVTHGRHTNSNAVKVNVSIFFVRSASMVPSVVLTGVRVAGSCILPTSARLTADEELEGANNASLKLEDLLHLAHSQSSWLRCLTFFTAPRFSEAGGSIPCVRMAPGAFTTVLLGLWITSRAVRPSREDFGQLQGTEVAPPDDLQIREAGAAFLQGGSESAGYPHCDGLPGNGSHVIDTPLVIRTSCTWHGHPGLQVALKKPISFQGSLILMGEIQITAVQELDGPCFMVFGSMTVMSANASFVGCRSTWQGESEAFLGKGGGLFIERDFMVSHSDVKFQSCRAPRGGGLYTRGFSQEASTVTFENCTAARNGGGAHVENSFRQGPNSSAIFRRCTADNHGGLYASSYVQEAGSSVVFENCSAVVRDGGGAYLLNNFTQGRSSSAVFRSCGARENGGGLYASSYMQEAGSSAVFENCSAVLAGGGALVKNFTQGLNSSTIFRSCHARTEGGGLFASSYQQEADSAAVFENCSANIGGGASVNGLLRQGPHSSTRFRNCSAHGFGAWAAEFQPSDKMTPGSRCCLRVFDYQQDVGSSAVFEDCDANHEIEGAKLWGARDNANGDGGCVYVGTRYGGAGSAGSFTQGPNSSAHFRSCMAWKYGGCLRAVHYQQDIGSSAVFEDCSANDIGGGAHVVQNFTQRPSSFVHFRSCRATSRGGALVVENYEQDGGSAVFENCSANGTKSEGGAVFVGNIYNKLGSFTQGSNSAVHFRSGRATERCLRALHYQQGVGSSAVFEHCIVDGEGESDMGGGGAFLSNNFTQGPNSSVHFRRCRSTKRGDLAAAVFVDRGLIADNYQQDVSSSAVFEDCVAADDGGGAHVSSNFTQGPNSSVHFRRCRSTKHGGGISVAGYQQKADSVAFFENCSADRGEGGGLQTSDLDANGSMHFKTCRAELGGGLMISQGGAVHHRGSLVFEACNARNGGGLHSNAGQGHFANLRFDACDAGVVGAAFSAIADDGAAMEVRMEELWLLNAGRSNSKDFEVSGALKLGSTHLSSESSFGVYVSVRDLLVEDVMNCTKTPTCTFFANTSQSAGFLCPLGTGVVDFNASEEFGCFACKPGSTQVQTTTNRSCSPCPDGALLCLAGELKMTRGLMVELENVSRSFHCPNEASCPGGHVSQGRVQAAMCEDGYRGQGCTSCSDGHAMADNSVFSCTACSKDRRIQVVQWITFLSQRAFLFALGAFSALGAKKAGDLKQSSIYLNQLMAFATISNTILAAVLQTKTAKDIKSEAANFFFNAAAHTAEAASGQGSLRSASSQCLLSYVGYEKTLWGAHLLEVVVAAGLMSSLSLMKDFRAALIAGINCFLPAIAADFGKYFVCFRLQPSDDLYCPFIPGFAGLAGATQVAVGLTVFMVAALWTWLSLSRSEEDPPPSHVVFLTSKYQPRYALFETERLIRKTLFTFIGALLPISSPALQMGCLGMVVWVALFLYCLYQPYHTPEWNWIEICLLFVAMLMILSVSTLLANEFHWGHSVPTQQSIIFTTAAVAAVASAIMTFRVMQELVREQRQDSILCLLALQSCIDFRVSR
eukprot:s4908_g1.t4